MSETTFELTLVAVDNALDTAWRDGCGDLPGVEVVNGDIFSVDADAVVSPANSYGFMEGGIDAAYVAHFGAEVQAAVRRRILERHYGELLVGAADVVETGDTSIPFLIAAPTMRVPMRLVESVNAYLAARAVFLLVQRGTFGDGPYVGELVKDHVTRVAMPGLGTGVGGLRPEVCALQVRAAFEDVLLGVYQPPRSWAEATQRHHQLLSGQSNHT